VVGGGSISYPLGSAIEVAGELDVKAAGLVGIAPQGSQIEQRGGVVGVAHVAVDDSAAVDLVEDQ
jgi:hypothetical protein